MKYKVEVSEGCLATGIYVNGKSLSGDDPRYCLSNEELKEFEEATLEEIRRAFHTGEVTMWDLLGLLHYENYETTDEPCESCGDYVTTRYYEF